MTTKTPNTMKHEHEEQLLNWDPDLQAHERSEYDPYWDSDSAFQYEDADKHDVDAEPATVVGMGIPFSELLRRAKEREARK